MKENVGLFEIKFKLRVLVLMSHSRGLSTELSVMMEMLDVCAVRSGALPT